MRMSMTKDIIKTVSFNVDIDIYMTYSSDEYCRHQIKSTKLKFLSSVLLFL